MRKLFVALSLIISAGAWSQTLADPKSISIMGVPLEGPDSVFIPALDSAGVKQVFIPKDNVDDLKDVAEEVKAALEITPVSTVQEVLSALGLPVMSALQMAV